jgi:hypothetical protein
VEAPNVRSVKVWATIESVLEAKCNPGELDEYLRANKFTGTANSEYDASYRNGGLRTVVTKEKIELTMKELDEVLQRRRNIV